MWSWDGSLQAIQAQLAAVGIRVEIVSRDASSMREAVRKATPTCDP